MLFTLTTYGTFFIYCLQTWGFLFISMSKKAISYSAIEVFYVSATQWQPMAPILQECFASSLFNILQCVLKENGSAFNRRCVFPRPYAFLFPPF